MSRRCRASPAYGEAMSILRYLRGLFQGARGSDLSPLVEYPKIALWSVNRIPCRFCKRGLEDNDLVVWFERTTGWRSEPAHAACAIVIRKDDGTLTRIDRELTLIEREHGRMMVPGMLLLTEEEWDAWDKSARTQVASKLVREGKTPVQP